MVSSNSSASVFRVEMSSARNLLQFMFSSVIDSFVCIL
jgi:hypothetical protein